MKPANSLRALKAAENLVLAQNLKALYQGTTSVVPQMSQNERGL
jgi:hypothetical protein